MEDRRDENTGREGGRRAEKKAVHAKKGSEVKQVEQEEWRRGEPDHRNRERRRDSAGRGNQSANTKMKEGDEKMVM